jgi:hypothetical protein
MCREIWNILLFNVNELIKHGLPLREKERGELSPPIQRKRAFPLARGED